MALGSAAKAHLTVIVWCKDCRRQIELQPAEMAERCGGAASVMAWSKRLLCGRCGSRNVDSVVSGPHHDPLSR